MKVWYAVEMRNSIEMTFKFVNDCIALRYEVFVNK